MLAIENADPAHPEAAELIAALDGDLHGRYPGMPIHGIDAAGFIAAGGVFLLARLEGRAAACGGIRPIGESTVEVKRMFVRPEYRGRAGRAPVLAALESAAARRGCRTVRLETGDRQTEAIGLYQSSGYRPIPCFGEYVSDARCLCFEKNL